MSNSPKVGSTSSAASNYDQAPVVTTNGRPDRLRSDLFTGDRYLHQIYRGDFLLDKSILQIPGRNPNKPHRSVKKIQAALKIVIPEMEGVEARQIAAVRELNVNGVYDEDTRGWVYIFQERAGLQPDEKVGPNTLLKLDNNLQQIRYYSAEPGREKTLHNASKANYVGRFTRVSTRDEFCFPTNSTLLQVLSDALDNEIFPAQLHDAFVAENVTISANAPVSTVKGKEGQIWHVEHQQTQILNGEEIVAKERYRIERYEDKDPNKTGLYVYAASTWFKHEPLFGFESVEIIEGDGQREFSRLVFGDRVLIVQTLPDNWCFVKRDDGAYGYVRTPHIWTYSEMPDPNAELYRIHYGDTLESIIDQFDKASTTGTGAGYQQDRRFYANVILYINNPEGKSEKTRHALNPESGAYDQPEDVPAAIYLKEGGQVWGLDELWETIDELRDDIAYYKRTWVTTEEKLNNKFGGWNTWNQAVIRANFFLWLPSKSFAGSLKAYVDTGTYVSSAVNDFEEAARAIDKALSDKAEKLWKDFKQGLDTFWPCGMGIRLDASIGATFGYPVSLDYDYNFYLWRDWDDTIKLLRRGVIGGGFDTGVGAGAFFGVGKNPKGWKKENDKESCGLGAEMGASFQAGAQVLMVQEMTFPIKEDLALATLFYELMNSAQAGPSSLIGDMLKPLFMFFNIDPTEYTTMLKLQIGTYVRGTASVTAGLRYGDTNTVKTWSNSDKEEAFTKGDGWRLFFLANMLSASIGLGPEGQLAMGLEYKVLAPPDSGHQPFLVDPVSGNRIPRLCEFNAYTEAQAALNMQLPILSSLPLPIPPSFGGGIKLNFIYKFRAEDHLPGNEADHRFEKFRLGFYQVSGELDIYQGSASEVVVWFDPTALTGPVDLNPGGVQQALINAVPTTFNDLREMVDGTQVKIRLGLNGIGGWRNKLKLFMQKMRSLHILIKHDGKRHWGLIYGLYLDLEFTLPKDEIANLAEEVFEDIRDKQGQGVQEAAAYILEYWQVGRPPKKKVALVTKFLQKLDKQKAVLHGELGTGVGAGVKAGALGKVRLRGYGGGSLIGHVPVTLEEVTRALALGQAMDGKMKLLTAPQQVIDQFMSE